jgi:hypothetical protein
MTNLRDYILSNMPPIGGVANGAMVQSNCSFSDLTYDTLQIVMKPKVEGSLILDEVFPDDNLEFFILFSSISAVVGQQFQSNYDAANNVGCLILCLFYESFRADFLIVYERIGVTETRPKTPCNSC